MMHRKEQTNPAWSEYDNDLKTCIAKDYGRTIITGLLKFCLQSNDNSVCQLLKNREANHRKVCFLFFKTFTKVKEDIVKHLKYFF